MRKLVKIGLQLISLPEQKKRRFKSLLAKLADVLVDFTIEELQEVDEILENIIKENDEYHKR